MKTKIFIIPIALLLLTSMVMAASIVRTVPASVDAGQTFTVTYTSSGTPTKWGASIQDSVSGGCTFPSGSSTYKTVMLSEDGNTKSITMTAPSSGSCVFSGDYKFGTDSVVSMTSSSVTISTEPPKSEINWALWIGLGVGALVLIFLLKKK
jgi:hypothetical protein